MSTYLGLAACTVLAMFIRGYSFGVSDQAFYLPFFQKWSHPNLFPHDFLFTYASGRDSPIWTLLWYGAQLFPIRVLFALLYAVLSYGMLLMAYHTARLLWTSERAAWLAALLWIPSYTVPGSAMQTMEPYLHGRAFGILCGMASLYAFLKRKDAHSAIALWVGGVLRLVSVVHLAAGLALAGLVTRKWHRVAWVIGGTALAALSLIMLWRYYGVAQDHGGRYTGEWYDMVVATMPELFPQAWSSGTWLHLFLYGLGSIGLGAWAVRRGILGKAGQDLLVVFFGLALVSVLGLAAIWGSHLKAAALLVPFQGTYYLVYGAVLMLAGLLEKEIEGGGPFAAVGCVFVAGAWMTGDSVDQMYALLMLTAILGRYALCTFISEASAWVGPRPLFLGILLAFAGSQALLYYGGVSSSDLARRYLPTGGGIEQAATFTCLVFLIGAIFTTSRWPGKVLARVPLWPIPLALTMLFYLPGTVLNTMVSIPQFKACALSRPALKFYGPSLLRRMREAVERERPLNEEVAMERLVAKMVPAGATVIVPPSWEGFRLRTRRSSFVTYKDRNVALFSRSFCVEWLTRMRAIHALRVGYTLVDESSGLTLEELRALAIRYRFCRLEYVISSRGYDLPMVARAGSYTLYDIRPSQPRSP